MKEMALHVTLLICLYLVKDILFTIFLFFTILWIESSVFYKFKVYEKSFKIWMC